ncbi:acylphosphatase [Metabacillus indicus]|uniref:acylphosphatase n=1 Tax=Metabacillus indicus TaxID=246786 RepID=UPI002A0714C5|nr:acylphosphatase [Metabacillus indicus]MDX8289178.1 acylphosphatase [Metabacillus indicus]
MKTIHLIVYGHVQGVGFRYFAQNSALSEKVTGWVKNKEDGTVEAVAQGTENQLESFVRSLRSGNRYARVEEIKVSEADQEQTYTGFKIIR